MRNLQASLKSWLAAGLIDAAAAERIRAFEASHSSPRLRWPILLALGLGGLTLGAGVLLFVGAHWDTLSPTFRFLLVLCLVGCFHLAASLSAERFPALGTTLHAVGTATLGAGIYLAGQIFNLQEHWPAGLLLWGLGAGLGWLLLGDWAQAVLTALLVPGWLAGEWSVATDLRSGAGAQILAGGLLLLAITYLGATLPGRQGVIRRALAWIGGLALIPYAFGVVITAGESSYGTPLSTSLLATGWGMALVGPLLLAAFLRGRAILPNLVAAAWVLTGLSLGHDPGLPAYLWGAVGALSLVGWGLMESSPQRINLGVTGFAITLLAFYFSSVMDRLGRSLSLIGLGVILLAGGWALERTRRRLVARVTEPTP